MAMSELGTFVRMAPSLSNLTKRFEAGGYTQAVSQLKASVAQSGQRQPAVPTTTAWKLSDFAVAVDVTTVAGKHVASNLFDLTR
jgi:hypothetical protein